jgi:hypothetical protein
MKAGERQKKHVEKVGLFDENPASGGVAVDRASQDVEVGPFSRRFRRGTGRA